MDYMINIYTQRTCESIMYGMNSLLVTAANIAAFVGNELMETDMNKSVEITF